MTIFLKMAPTDQTGPSDSREGQRMASGLEVVPTLTLLVKECPRNADKTGLDVCVGIWIKTIFVEESVCNLIQDECKQGDHLRRNQNGMSLAYHVSPFYRFSHLFIPANIQPSSVCFQTHHACF